MSRQGPWLNKVSSVHWIHDPYSKAKANAHYNEMVPGPDAHSQRNSSAPHGSRSRSRSRSYSRSGEGGGASASRPQSEQSSRGSGRHSVASTRHSRRHARRVEEHSGRSVGSADRRSGARSSMAHSRSNGDLKARYSLGMNSATAYERSGGLSRPRGFRSGGWVDKPVHATRSEMLATRKHSGLPDKSFDVDGDGVVSAQDYFLATQFDVNKDGVLDKEEVVSLRKQMVSSLIGKFNEVPRVPDKHTKQLIRRFTKDVDRTVEKDTFLKDYNELYNRTAQSIAVDSSQVFKCLQPMTLNSHAHGGARAAPEDTRKAGRGSYSGVSGHSSRKILLASRRHDNKQFANRAEDRRMLDHIHRRNECGADIPIPPCW